jgi:hypothetical protein
MGRWANGKRVTTRMPLGGGLQEGRKPCRKLLLLSHPSRKHGSIGNRDSAVCMATGSTAEESEFESQSGKDFSPLHVVQTGSQAHPASCPVGAGDSFPGGKAAGA